MENEKVNVQQELQQLETQIGQIMVGFTQDEITAAKRQIQKMSMEIEDCLRYYGSVPRDVISKMVERVNDQVLDLVNKEVATGRKREYEETRFNLSTVGNNVSKQMTDNLAVFEQEGVALKDNKYNETLDEISSRVVSAYRKPIEATDARRADEVIFEIKRIVSKTSHDLQDLHGEYSANIKQEVKKRVYELGIKINSELEQQIDKEVEDVQQKEQNDFASSLQSQTKSDEEISRSDIEDLSENQKVFKDSPDRDESNRKKYEDMFK